MATIDFPAIIVAPRVFVPVHGGHAEGPVQYGWIRRVISAAERGAAMRRREIHAESSGTTGESPPRYSLDLNESQSVVATFPNGYQQAVTPSGGEDATCVVTGLPITGASRGIHCPAHHLQCPTAISYGISASVWKGSQTRRCAFRGPTRRRHQTHDRQQHLRRQL